MDQDGQLKLKRDGYVWVESIGLSAGLNVQLTCFLMK